MQFSLTKFIKIFKSCWKPSEIFPWPSFKKWFLYVKKKKHWYFDFQYDTHVIKPGISTIVNNKWLVFKLIKNTFKRACQLQLVTVTTTSGTATSSLKINTVGSLEFTLKRFLRGSEELSVSDTKPNDCCLQFLKATRW